MNRTRILAAPSAEAPAQWAGLETPIGVLTLEARRLEAPVEVLPSTTSAATPTWIDEVLTALYLDGRAGASAPAVVPAERTTSPLLLEAAAQVRSWFEGRRTTFELPLAPRGTPFQRAVWTALLDVPYGTTTSYGALAERIGRPAAVRAVGSANARNPLALVLPCHRILGRDGTLTGYAGGLATKRWLLDFESARTRPTLFAP